MNKKIIYTKFSKTRKKGVSITTSIFLDKQGKLGVEKKGDEESKKTIDNLVDTYKRIKNISKKFEVVPIKQTDEYTVEFPFINGLSLQEQVSSATSKEDFHSLIEYYIELLDSIPTKTCSLGNDFERVFGKVEKDKEYVCLKEGVLDLNLSNLIIDPKGKAHFFDYEWCYDFPIPKDFVLFRVLMFSYINSSSRKFYTLQDLLEKYLIQKSNIETYHSWEKHFQQKIVHKNYDDPIYTLPIIDINVQTIQAENEKIKQEMDTLLIKNTELMSEIQKVLTENEQLLEEKGEIISELEVFKSFKKSKIWKSLTIWRKLKKYFRNFFINIRNDGPRKTFKRIFTRIKNIIKYRQELKKKSNPYIYWLKNHKITPKKRTQLKKELKNLKYKPLISIVMPVYNVDKKWIKRAVKSIKRQIYPNWELCIADDASTNQKLKKHLRRINNDKKIKVFFRKKNGHISEASNSALKLATGEFVALMDNDDIIHPHALLEVVKVLNKNKDTDLIYSDEDKIDIRERRMEPFFKPAWSPDLFMSTNYLCHLTVIRKRLIDEVEGFRKGYEGSQDYDLFLRITEKTNNIVHIPDVLYSWRKIPGSTAYEYNEKNYADITSIKTLEDSLERRNIQGSVSLGLFPGSFRVKYKIQGEPLVSIIIPTKNKLEYIQRCISSLLDKTTYKNYEVIIIDTNSTNQETMEYYETLRENPKIKFLEWKKTFNYSSVNNYGVDNTNGEYVVLLNNDTEIITPNWIEGMLEHAQRKEIGAVGVKLLYPNNTIQHAGIILGINGGTGKGVAGHAFRLSPRKVQGFPIQKDIIKNFSAVTAACLMISKKKYEEVGGLNEDFRIAFNDVDFGMRLNKAGYFNLYTPHVELYHHESVSVGKPEAKTRDNDEFCKEIDLMYKKWEKEINNDPFYNPNLSLTSENFFIKTERL